MGLDGRQQAQPHPQCQLQLQGWRPDWEKQGVTPSPALGLLGVLPAQEPLSEPRVQLQDSPVIV